MNKNNILENPVNLLKLSQDELNTILAECTHDEIIFLIGQAESFESQYDVAQMTKKILMNSLYGALGNRYFPLFNEQLAQAITGNGRYFIQMAARFIEEGLQALHKWDRPYLVYGDTDSVLGDTLVKTENGEIAIEKLYELLNGEIETRGVDNFIKHINEHIKAASVSKDMTLEFNNINYVMKHKVKKRMFKITCDNDEVVVTEDHSVMIVRDDKLISCKPYEILKTDKIVKIIND